MSFGNSDEKFKKLSSTWKELKPHGFDVVSTDKTSETSILIKFAVFGVVTLFLPFVMIPVAILLAVSYGAWVFLKDSRKRKSRNYIPVLESDVAVPPGTKETKGKKVCVIGAGASGLVTVKELLDEEHEVVVYEKYKTFGGVFLYGDFKGGVYDSTLLTISNYLMAFSDFFKVGDSCRYWHHSEYYNYLGEFINHFKLTTKARFNYNTTVTSVKRSPSNPNKWIVETSGEVSEKLEFDAIAICSGTHQKPNWPEYEGMKESRIQFIHSESYKTARNNPLFEGKKVVVVGAGETGADLAAEIADVAKEAYISMRRPPHVVARNLWSLNKPSDVHSTRAMFYCNWKVIDFLHGLDFYLKKIIGNSALGCSIFRGVAGLGDPVSAKISELSEQSGGGVTHQFLCKNDNFIFRLVNGKLQQKPNISKFEPNSKTVYFTDGTKLEDVDTIMLCTGYRDDFPFLESVVSVNAVRDLYKHAFHPDIGSSIAWIGFVRPSSGGVPACSELVARYWSLLLSNKRKLPGDWKQRIQLEKTSESNLLFLGRVKTLVLWGDYVESMAHHIGCHPNLFRILLTRPTLWYRLYFGSLVPFQFRIRGPHAKPDFALKVIEHVPVSTPVPFRVILSIGGALGWVCGSFFDSLTPAW